MLWLPNFLFADVAALTPQDQQSVEAVRRFYGQRAGLRTESWRRLVEQGRKAHWDERRALTEVNRFFNQLLFIDDIKLWGMKDYWAMPQEFLGAAGGDCEDYSISKYFTLLELGIPEEKMRMVYVKALA